MLGSAEATREEIQVWLDRALGAELLCHPEPAYRGAMPANYEEYIVTFLDILGFRELIRSRSAEEVDQIIKLTRRHAADEEGEQRELGLRTVAFSDSVIRMRKASETSGLHFELMDLLHAQAGLLSYGVLVRGGIALGKVFQEDDRIFGPAFVEAYELESKVAVYPRVVVAPKLLGALVRGALPMAHVLEDELGYVMETLAVGDDGIYSIDYLRAFKWELDEPEHYPDFLAAHRKVVADMGATIRDGSGAPSSLELKANWLARYHNAVVGEVKALGVIKDDALLLTPNDVPSLFVPPRYRKPR